MKAATELRGGLGGTAPIAAPVAPETVLIDERTPGKDLKLVQAAIKKGWNIPDEILDGLPAEMWEMVKDKNLDDRARVNAGKLLTTMYAQANPPTAAGQTINVGVAVNTNDDLYD